MKIPGHFSAQIYTPSFARMNNASLARKFGQYRIFYGKWLTRRSMCVYAYALRRMRARMRSRPARVPLRDK